MFVMSLFKDAHQYQSPISLEAKSVIFNLLKASVMTFPGPLMLYGHVLQHQRRVLKIRHSKKEVNDLFCDNGTAGSSIKQQGKVI